FVFRHPQWMLGEGRMAFTLRFLPWTFLTTVAHFFLGGAECAGGAPTPTASAAAASTKRTRRDPISPRERLQREEGQVRREIDRADLRKRVAAADRLLQGRALLGGCPVLVSARA